MEASPTFHGAYSRALDSGEQCFLLMCDGLSCWIDTPPYLSFIHPKTRLELFRPRKSGFAGAFRRVNSSAAWQSVTLAICEMPHLWVLYVI